MSQIVIIGNWIRQFDAYKFCEENEKAFLKSDEFKDFSKTSFVSPNKSIINFKIK